MESKIQKQHVYIFLPHHDDEIFILSWLIEYMQGKVDFHFNFIFFVNDDIGKCNDLTRQRNSHELIRKIIPVQKYQIIELGVQLKIKPRHVIEHRSELSQVLKDILLENIAAEEEILILTPLIQNTHIDHLEVSRLALENSSKATILFYPTYSIERLWTVSVWNKSNSKTKPYKLNYPRILQTMYTHKSEWKTWLLLGPILILKGIVSGNISYLFDANDALTFLTMKKKSWFNSISTIGAKWKNSNFEFFEEMEVFLSEIR